MAFEQILTETTGRVGIITFNRPDRLNAMSKTMETEMREQVGVWNEDDSVGAIVLTGSGRAFCSGADISSFEATVRGDAPRGGTTLPSAAGWIEQARESKPIVCAINGFAVGVGLTMTLPCDIRVVAEGAKLSFRFVKLGLTPEFASTHYLAQLVGLGRSMELMLTARFIEAREAAEIGLVNHVYPAENMLEEAVSIAQDIAASPTWQLQQTKRLVHEHYMSKDPVKVTVEEMKIFRESQATETHKEALLAFREKREPRFH